MASTIAYEPDGRIITPDAPFDILHIPMPEKLKDDADYAQLFEFIISEFRHTINLYEMRYGYVSRQYLLSTMLNALTDRMPKAHPEFIANYPSSIGSIKNYIAKVMQRPQNILGQYA